MAFVALAPRPLLNRQIPVVSAFVRAQRCRRTSCKMPDAKANKEALRSSPTPPASSTSPSAPNRRAPAALHTQHADQAVVVDALAGRLEGLAVSFNDAPSRLHAPFDPNAKADASVPFAVSLSEPGDKSSAVRLSVNQASSAPVVSSETATASSKLEPPTVPELRRDFDCRGTQRKVRIIYSEKFLEHKSPRGRHPECPERLQVCVDALRKDSRLIDLIEWVEPTPVDPGSPRRDLVLDCIRHVHSYPDYLEDLEAMSKKGGGFIDGDTYVAKGSFEIALLAVSAWLDAVDYALSENGSGPVLALARPPGHHATRVTGMGFCLLSNAAISAHYALRKVARVGILDFDVHHGNGTEVNVKNEPRIRFTSSHQEAIFPMTGDPSIVGPHRTILNVALKDGDGMEEYRNTFNEKMLPHILDCGEGEDPTGLVIVSAGYDTLDVDPLAGLTFTPENFNELARTIVRATQIATNHERVVFGLEGGYDLTSRGISAAVCNTLYGLTELTLE